jgi:hypothetical protein
MKMRDAVDELDAVKELTVSRVENELEILSEKTDNEMKITETIKMTDLNFRVVK